MVTTVHTQWGGGIHVEDSVSLSLVCRCKTRDDFTLLAERIKRSQRKSVVREWGDEGMREAVGLF